MPISTNDSKTIVRRLIDEIIQGRHYERANEVLAEDYTRHDSNEHGIEPFLDHLEMLHTAFTDAKLELGELIAEDDLVALEATWSGTHEGPFMGVEPTGEAIEIRGNAMHRVRDGKIVESWWTWDRLGILEQIGAIEPPL